MLYLCSFLFKNLLAYAIGCQLLFCFCSRHAPSPSLLASHFTCVSLLILKCFCSTIFCIACFILLNATVCWSFHSNFFLDVVADKRCLIGADSVARFGMNFIRWWMPPINYLCCFSVLGFSSWVIASVFCLVGFIPSEFILYPNHVNSFSPNWFLCRLIPRFSSFSLCKVLSTSFSWSSRVPFGLWFCHLRTRSSSWICPVLCPSFFRMLLEGLSVSRIRWGIFMYLWRFPLICYSCSVYVYPDEVVSGCMRILDLFCWSIIFLLLLLVLMFSEQFYPLGDLCFAVDILLWIASFRILEAIAILFDWSDFAIMTTGLMKCSSELFDNFLSSFYHFFC